MPDAWHLIGEQLTADQLTGAARKLLEVASDQKVWLFYGEMGAGKTTFIKAIGEVKGVYGGMSSPTFSIINEYHTVDGNKIYHFDLYRIKNERELIEIGADEYFDSNELCLVEWPEKLGSLTPPNSFSIRITTTGPVHRTIEYKKHGS